MMQSGPNAGYRYDQVPTAPPFAPHLRENHRYVGPAPCTPLRETHQYAGPLPWATLPSPHPYPYPYEQAPVPEKYQHANSDSRSFNARVSKTQTRRIFIGIALLIGSVLFLIIFIPIFFTTGRHSRGSSNLKPDPSPSAGGSTLNDDPKTSSSERRGGDFSRVTMDNGEVFVYRNTFGGFWIHDPSNPFNNNAQPNSWTPPLNTSWQWGKDRIFGVNLGGLFVLEPFITPALFQKYPTAVDEYTLSVAMAADQQGGGLRQIEDHYASFITERDIADIAGAGLNWVRIPLGFWAIEVWDGEPFLAKTSWSYFLRVVEWARKYGLRVAVDLHAVPGSQNGYNHSGRLGHLNFLAGNMGIANAERTLYYLRVLVEYISQPQYRDVILAIELVNEPLALEIGIEPLHNFYLRAYNMIREITGFGAGNGPFIAISDGLRPLDAWHGILPGADRVAIDGHPYFAFSSLNFPLATPGEDGQPGGVWPRLACNTWGPGFNASRKLTGVTFAGEFSTALNDCGLFILGPGTYSQHSECPEYDNWEGYNSTMKAGLQNFLLASFDALGDFFFWTWKIGPSIAGRVEAPLWSYQLGLEHGWVPRDPRASIGKCASLGATLEPFDGAFQPWQTGSASAPIISPEYVAQYPWPPTNITRVNISISLLPTYTNTAPVITLPVPTFTGAQAAVTQGFDGWFNDGDRQRGITTVAGCPYPAQYTGTFEVTPTAPCTGPTHT